MSFTAKILIGLFLGLATGLFLGEIAAPLSVGGEIYIGLLQMTVLPYIVVSLVANLGRISWDESRELLVSAITALAVLLSIGILVLWLAPLAFPPWQTASFFSTSLVAVPTEFNLVELYVPANPFGSLANNVVPAVVLFSILVGIGVSRAPDRDGLLRILDVLATALNNVNKLVIRLTPLGIFAIAAGTAGTISLEEVNRLQAYVITYTVLAVILTFGVLPLLVSSVTPFRMRDLILIPRDTLITIFATAKIIVVLPQLVEDVKTLFRRNAAAHEDVDSGAEVLMPLAYPFPNIGTYVILMFVPFSAWYLGREMNWADELVFQGASLLSSFVAPVVGIPFLLDVQRLPADMMELFIVSTVYTDRIRVVLGAMHLLSLTIVAIAYKRGLARWQPLRFARAAGLSLLMLLVGLFGTRFYLAQSLADTYTADQELVRMHQMEPLVDVVEWRKKLPPPDEEAGERGRLATIASRKTLRIGYLKDSLPFAFTNSEGQVVGFDIELGLRMAYDLGVDAELVRIEYDEIAERFAKGQIDIVMSGLAMTPERLLKWDFPISPMDLTMGFLVPDHKRRSFESFEEIGELGEMVLGVVVDDRAFSKTVRSKVPGARIENLESPREFLRGQRPDIDAVVYSAEGGSAWTLVYPEYAVAVPHPVIQLVPEGYPIAKGDLEWAVFVSDWIRLKKKDQTIDALYDHWILGRGAGENGPRWSVVRDVLGWVD